MNELEDEIELRKHALEILENDTEELVGDLRRARAQERFGDDPGIYHDDLDQAEQVSQLLDSPVSSLDAKAGLRQQKWNAEDKIANYVRINPQSANRGTLGGQQTVFLNGQALPVCNWASDSDTESTTITITIAPVQQIAQQDMSLKTFRPYAIIQFGNRAMSVKAEIDIGTGQQLTVSASSVIVQVGLDPSIINLADTNNHMQLCGMLSFLPIERDSTVYRTRYIDNAVGGSTTTFDVPPFASNVVLWRDIGEGVTINFLDKGGTVIYSFPLAANVPMLVPVPVTADIVKVSVVDTAGAGITHGRLIFGLNF